MTRFIPVTKSRDEIREIYSKLSHVYDFWSSLTERKATGRALELARVRNGESILEVAVGTGRVFERIISSNMKGRNEGVDLSPDMLAMEERRLRDRFSNFMLKEADACALPFADGTFDLVMSNYLFDLLQEGDFPHVLGEFRRVLRPGGRVVITTMTMGMRWYNRFWDWVARRMDLLAGCRPVSFEEDLQEAGFRNLHAECVTQFTFPSPVIRAEKP
jgi:ubiquinone/menaquinone biosynthesis C-methylase UbiE